MKSVLVVDASPDLVRLFAETLPGLFPDWKIHEAHDLRTADRVYRDHVLSLVVLDMDFGGAAGESFELLRAWNAEGRQCPVVATTASRAALTRIWTESPDEVLLKPWDPLEIKPRLSRVAAARRAAPETTARADGVALRGEFRFGGAHVTPDLLCRFPDGHRESLAAKEYGVLVNFAANRGTLVTREKLLRAVWGADADSSSNSVNVYISRLRRLFEEHGANFATLVSTETKVGWRIAPSVDE